jgi:hypothetical protein
LRKFYHRLSLFVMLSYVIVNYWKKVKQPSHTEVNQDHVLLRSFLALSSSSHPPKSLSKVVVKFSIKKVNSHDLSKSKIHFPKFSSPKWVISLNWFFISCLKPMKVLLSLKGVWTSNVLLQLFSQNWTVWFLRF